MEAAERSMRQFAQGLRGSPSPRTRGARAGLICLAALGAWESAGAVNAIECDTGVPASAIRLFDGHDHLRITTTAEGEAALATLAAQGVSLGMLGLGTPDSSELVVALELQATSPTPFFAFVMPPPVTGGGGEKTFDATTLAFVQLQLDAGTRGIGEVSLRHSGPPLLAANIPANQATAMLLYAEAATRSLPVVIHFETRDKSAPSVDIPARLDELEAALNGNPNTQFILAHLGDTDFGTIRTLIENHDNLYADLSSRNPHFVRGWPMPLQSLSDGPTGTGNLKTGWKDLFEDHPERFLFGLDLANPDRWSQLPQVVSYYRGVLGELSQSTAEKIACKNARSLLGPVALPGPRTPWPEILVLMMLLGGAILLRRMIASA